jgi:hypothetical protein
MRQACLALATAVVLTLSSASASAQNAQQERMRTCNAEAASQHVSGSARRSFITECLRRHAAEPAPTGSSRANPPSSPPPPSRTTAAPRTQSRTAERGRGGQDAEHSRIRTCGQEWRQAKAAGRVQQGMSWPQYWSDCDKRMKAQGM